MNHFLVLTSAIIFGTIAFLIFLSLAIRAIRYQVKGPDPKWTVNDIPQALAKAQAEGWIHRSLAAFDIAVNVIGLRGQQDETISTHSYRAFLEKKLWGKCMCWWLNGFQANHGPKAACGDYVRARNRVAILNKILGL